MEDAPAVIPPPFFSSPIVPRRFSSAKAGGREGPDREFSFPFLSDCAVTSTRVKICSSVLFRRKAKERGSVCAKRQTKNIKAKKPPSPRFTLRLSSSSCHIAAAGKRPPQVILPSCFRGGGGVCGERESVPASTTTSGGGGGGGLTCGRGKGIPPLSPPLIFFSSPACLLLSALLYARELKLPRPPQPQRWKISQGTRDAHTSPFPRKKTRGRGAQKVPTKKQVLGFPPPPKKV